MSKKKTFLAHVVSQVEVLNRVGGKSAIVRLNDGKETKEYSGRGKVAMAMELFLGMGDFVEVVTSSRGEVKQFSVLSVGVN